MILDQSHGHGACHGDSGGPAYIQKNGKMILAGVTNRSYPSSASDDCAHQVVYTKVHAYESWIKKNKQKLEIQKTNDLYRKKTSNHLVKHAHIKLVKAKTHHNSRTFVNHTKSTCRTRRS